MQRFIKPSRNGLIAIIVLYVLIIVLLLLFSKQILLDISKGESVSSSFFFPIIIIIPFGLLIFIIVNLVRIMNARRSRQSGAQFRLKIVAYFVLITIFSGIPQGVLSINLITTAMNYWYAPNVQQALEGGEHIALTYYQDKLDTINTVLNNTAFRTLSTAFQPSRQRVWQFIEQNYPDVSSLQVFDSSGKSIFFAGDETSKLDYAAKSSGRITILPPQRKNDFTIQRGVSTISTNSFIVSIILPAAFTETANLLTRAKESFIQMEIYKEPLKWGILAFFSVFAFPLFFLSLMLAFLLTEEIVAPVIYLEDATKKIAEGDYSFRILGKRYHELSFLVNSFNDMVSHIEKTRYQTMQTDKLAAWQEIAQRMAHEVKNPLTPIKLSAELLLKKFENKEDLSKILPRSVKSIITEVNNMNKLIQEFRDFSRTTSLYQKKENINHIISESIRMHQQMYPGIQFNWESDKQLEPFIDKTQITRVFTNLINNAAESMMNYGIVYVRTDLVRKGNKDYCRIQVQDTGQGIPEKMHNQVFNPYFTTKDDGSGLGLAIIERIIFDHAGIIWFESEPGSGTTFFIDLPME